MFSNRKRKKESSSMEEILKQVQAGTISIENAMEKLATYEDLGFVKIDHHRKKRQGFPEVIYGDRKTVDQLKLIIKSMQEKRSEEHTSELQSRGHLVCRLLLENKNL